MHADIPPPVLALIGGRGQSLFPYGSLDVNMLMLYGE